MISSREKKIINELIYHSGTFLLIKELADKLGVSSRTVHRELKNVTETLEQLDIQMIREYKKGVKVELDTDEMDALTAYINAHADKDLSNEEKKVALIYNLMLNTEGIKKSALAVELGVSEHTVDELIGQMTDTLRAFELEITKIRSIGIQLVGDELNKQNFLADMMVNELNSNSIYSVIENNFVFSSLVNNKIMGLLEADNIFKVERLLMDELDVLPYQLTENAYLNLTLHIVLAIDRTEHSNNVSVKQSLKEELGETQEFEVSLALTSKLETEFSITFPEEEVYFICMHLRGSRRKFQSERDTDSIESSTVQFINTVSQRMDYPFYAYPELKEGLILHIEPTLHRMESGIITVNPLLDTIKEKYPALFEVVGESFKQHFGTRKLNESEIGFLIIHFGGILHANPKIEVTTVCSSGIGTSRILANQLRTRFNNMYIRQELSISEVADTEIHDNELVLSTVPLDLENYILVSPLLDDSDEKKIMEAISRLDATPLLNTPDREKVMVEVDPEQVIQASELYLNRHFITDGKRADALTSVRQALSSETDMPQDDIREILTMLEERFETTGFVVGESGFSYPHIRSPVIKAHQMVFIHNTAGIEDRNYKGDAVAVNHQILLLVPEKTLVADMISEISILFGEHHLSIGQLFESPAEVENIIKNYIRTLYK
ncbi:BglG family transcription antiterminator [Salinicoccus hispanicus]|uniref:PRD domain-containing protein n=1 Tax=Salinicoccus hispanicus TaxID=157225 RepID=A0A6N8U6F0_9STAP|nr:transcription antiterminator [Salinicoccus hispanicus]MXQ51199.1 PRD domain-containing protein [Salinicoccus hispanicus]